MMIYTPSKHPVFFLHTLEYYTIIKIRLVFLSYNPYYLFKPTKHCRKLKSYVYIIQQLVCKHLKLYPSAFFTNEASALGRKMVFLCSKNVVRELKKQVLIYTVHYRENL